MFIFKKNIFLSFLIIIFILLLFFNLILFFNLKENKKLEVIFLNVGTGNSALIKTKNGKKILIDAGNDKIFFKSLRKELSFFDKHIDYLIASHSDIDHIGNFVDILKYYNVDRYFFNGAKRIEKGTFNNIYSLLKEKKIPITKLSEGDIIELSNDLKIKLFSPPDVLCDIMKFKSNTSSLVFQLIYKDKYKIMFTGDLPVSIEKFLVFKYGKELKSDILLAGHHGSKTSSSFEFVNTVLPDYVIISTSRKNSYGHPNEKVIERFKQINAKILYTFSDGNIVFEGNDDGFEYKK